MRSDLVRQAWLVPHTLGSASNQAARGRGWKARVNRCVVPAMASSIRTLSTFPVPLGAMASLVGSAMPFGGETAGAPRWPRCPRASRGATFEAVSRSDCSYALPGEQACSVAVCQPIAERLRRAGVHRGGVKWIPSARTPAPQLSRQKAFSRLGLTSEDP